MTGATHPPRDQPSGARARRPREHNRERILRATTALLREASSRSIASVTLSEVAVRSGVARTTVYRYWPSREALLLDTVRFIVGPLHEITGDLAADLDAVVRERARWTSRPEYMAALPLLFAVALEPSPLAERVRREVIAPGFDAFVRRYEETTDPEASVDAGLLLELVVGAALIHRLRSGRALSQQAASELALTVLRARRGNPGNVNE